MPSNQEPPDSLERQWAGLTDKTREILTQIFSAPSATPDVQLPHCLTRFAAIQAQKITRLIKIATIDDLMTLGMCFRDRYPFIEGCLSYAFAFRLTEANKQYGSVLLPQILSFLLLPRTFLVNTKIASDLMHAIRLAIELNGSPTSIHVTLFLALMEFVIIYPFVVELTDEVILTMKACEFKDIDEVCPIMINSILLFSENKFHSLKLLRFIEFLVNNNAFKESCFHLVVPVLSRLSTQVANKNFEEEVLIRMLSLCMRISSLSGEPFRQIYPIFNEMYPSPPLGELTEVQTIASVEDLACRLVSKDNFDFSWVVLSKNSNFLLFVIALSELNMNKTGYLKFVRANMRCIFDKTCLFCDNRLLRSVRRMFLAQLATVICPQEDAPILYSLQASFEASANTADSIDCSLYVLKKGFENMEFQKMFVNLCLRTFESGQITEILKSLFKLFTIAERVRFCRPWIDSFLPYLLHSQKKVDSGYLSQFLSIFLKCMSFSSSAGDILDILNHFADSFDYRLINTLNDFISEISIEQSLLLHNSRLYSERIWHNIDPYVKKDLISLYMTCINRNYMVGYCLDFEHIIGDMDIDDNFYRQLKAFILGESEDGSVVNMFCGNIIKVVLSSKYRLDLLKSFKTTIGMSLAFFSMNLLPLLLDIMETEENAEILDSAMPLFVYISSIISSRAVIDSIFSLLRKSLLNKDYTRFENIISSVLLITSSDMKPVGSDGFFLDRAGKITFPSCPWPEGRNCIKLILSFTLTHNLPAFTELPLVSFQMDSISYSVVQKGSYVDLLRGSEQIITWKSEPIATNSVNTLKIIIKSSGEISCFFNTKKPVGRKLLPSVSSTIDKITLFDNNVNPLPPYVIFINHVGLHVGKETKIPTPSEFVQSPRLIHFIRMLEYTGSSSRLDYLMCLEHTPTTISVVLDLFLCLCATSDKFANQLKHASAFAAMKKTLMSVDISIGLWNKICQIRQVLPYPDQLIADVVLCLPIWSRAPQQVICSVLETWIEVILLDANFFSRHISLIDLVTLCLKFPTDNMFVLISHYVAFTPSPAAIAQLLNGLSEECVGRLLNILREICYTCETWHHIRAAVASCDWLIKSISPAVLNGFCPFVYDYYNVYESLANWALSQSSDYNSNIALNIGFSGNGSCAALVYALCGSEAVQIQATILEYRDSEVTLVTRLLTYGAIVNPNMVPALIKHVCMSKTQLAQSIRILDTYGCVSVRLSLLCGCAVSKEVKDVVSAAILLTPQTDINKTKVSLPSIIINDFPMPATYTFRAESVLYRDCLRMAAYARDATDLNDLSPLLCYLCPNDPITARSIMQGSVITKYLTLPKASRTAALFGSFTESFREYMETMKKNLEYNITLEHVPCYISCEKTEAKSEFRDIMLLLAEQTDPSHSLPLCDSHLMDVWGRSSLSVPSCLNGLDTEYDLSNKSEQSLYPEQVQYTTSDNFIISGDNYGTVCLWSANWRLLRTVVGHSEKITACAISEELKLAVTLSKDILSTWSLSPEFVHLNRFQAPVPITGSSFKILIFPWNRVINVSSICRNKLITSNFTLNGQLIQSEVIVADVASICAARLSDNTEFMLISAKPSTIMIVNPTDLKVTRKVNVTSISNTMKFDFKTQNVEFEGKTGEYIDFLIG